DSYIQGKYYPAFSPVYGFVSFGPNRVFLKITNIQGDPISLSAYDLQDGNEGIYVVNNFRAEASREVLDDVIQDIN
ncbi:conjugative transposon protein TraM, partial [Zunongwangia atlantica]